MKKYILLFLIPFLLISGKNSAQAVLSIGQYSYFVAHDTLPAYSSDSVHIWIKNEGSVALNDNILLHVNVQDSSLFTYHTVDTTYTGLVSIPVGDSIPFSFHPFYNIGPTYYHYDINVIVIWPVASTATTGDSLTYAEFLTLPSGINDLDLNNYIKAYPNPSTDKLYIESDLKNTIEEVRIYDTKGQLISIIQNESIINTESWCPGMYFIDVKIKDGKSQTLKILKQ